jgi:RHH-type proline utilization regulon transcriptional repressor/proline dehydrogenase/delta 1-pyrroline-5-carboxylate dehydrogenase
MTVNGATAPALREDPVVARGRAVFGRMRPGAPALFDRRWWTGQVMALALRDPDFKVRLFRFIDVFPSLTTPDQVAAHVREYFLSRGMRLPGLVRLVLAGAAFPLTGRAAAGLVRRGIARFAGNFIAGRSPREALGALRRIRDEGRTFTVDILGETAVSEEEAAAYGTRYLDLVSELARETAAWKPEDPERASLFPRINVSVKLSSLYSQAGPSNHGDSVARIGERLRPILRRARGEGAFVNLDMEMHSLKEVTLDVFTGVMSEPEFADFPHAGLAVQAYLRESREDLLRLARWARDRRRRVTVRLVKGAYWEYEVVTARQKGQPVPVFLEKSHADWNFERCVETVFDNADCLSLAAGTHNVRSIAKVMAAAEERGVPPGRYEFQMLFGMADNLKEALGKMGHPVREYVPVGDLVPGMAYLVRRLLENSSNEGFLRRRYVDGAAVETLLAEPAGPPAEGPGAVVEAVFDDRTLFRNDPLADFSLRSAREACAAAIEAVRRRLGAEYPAVVGGREHREGQKIVSVNPARPGEVVGVVAGIDAALGEAALAAARKAQGDWARAGFGKRARILSRAARIARDRKTELVAWQVFEVGKNRVEADADVTEAIDHLEYYAREALRLGEPRQTGECPGEENLYFYRPRGVGLVISPWNFPLAIPVGMVSAALVAGNAVLFKPSSLSPVSGWLAFSLLREAGVPEGVLHFVPGPGEVVGRLAGHPGTDFIVFTGSREVGLSLVERAAVTAPGQKGIRRVVAEMGGKNAIIVDADADLDQAVPAVVQSAFGYQGQKCSACSRVIVHASCYDRFLRRLREAAGSLSMGPPDDPAFSFGPVIDGRAKGRILEYVELSRKEGTVFSPGAVPGEGFYVPPTVVTDLPPGSRVLREEIFGPVLSVVRAESLEEAVRIANDSDYALTGGLFSRSPSSIERVREAFEVGNLYINRGITGAVVGRQPFGGFRMSGVGSKAGGPDYLLQFMEPRVVTENTMRRGFSPDVMS